MNDARRDLFRNTNFRWLIGGGALSMLGDQFTLLALPWLVMGLSRDPLVLGTVLALGSLPRALFILVGGALVDRYSPRRVLVLTKWINVGLLGLLAALTATGSITLWGVYALTLAIGLATAFSYPAGSAILPQAVPAALLQPANGVLMGARQLVMLLGPVLAGLLVGSGSEPALQGHGLALAFGFDALSFAVSAWTLSKVTTAPRETPKAKRCSARSPSRCAAAGRTMSCAPSSCTLRPSRFSSAGRSRSRCRCWRPSGCRAAPQRSA